MEVNENKEGIYENQSTGLNVEATLKQLQQLAIQANDEEIGGNEESIEDLNELLTNISKLEDERRLAHETLEVETIAASKQRNALQVLPGRYRKEMEDAVRAARLANEHEMKSLQRKLSEAESDCEVTLVRQAQLLAENSKLRPDCDVIRREHDEIIAQLNQRMSDKANKQIVLNESRDALRDILQQTSEIDIGIDNVNYDLTIELNDAAQIKQTLLSQVEETTRKISEQKEKNSEEKRAVDKVQDRILELSAKLDEEHKLKRRMENSLGRLEVQALQLEDKIERERSAHHDLVDEREILQSVKRKQQAQYDVKVEELEKKLKVVLDQLAGARHEHEVICDEKSDVNARKEAAGRNKNKFASKVKEAALQVENMKKTASELVEQSGAISTSNKSIRDKLLLLDENHRATVDTYNVQIEEYKETLNQERQERVKVQDLRDESEKVLETFRSEQLKFMNEMSKSIEEARLRHQELSDKSMWLSRETEKNKRNIETLEVRLEVAEGGLRTMKASIAMEIERLQHSVEILGEDNMRKSKYLEDKAPDIERLKEELEMKTAGYMSLKDEVIVVRNREKSVKEQIGRIHLQIGKLAKPLEQLKTSLQESREHGMNQLEANASQRKNLETEIYETTIKLEQVVNSNDQFNMASEELQSEINELSEDMTSHTAHQRFLLTQLDELQSRFGEAWTECIEMEQASSDQDKEILGGISKVQRDTKERSETLNGISTHLKNELETLTGFVENVSNRRPKDTRQSKRRSMVPPSDSRIVQTPAILRKRRSSGPSVVNPVGTF